MVIAHWTPWTLVLLPCAVLRFSAATPCGLTNWSELFQVRPPISVFFLMRWKKGFPAIVRFFDLGLRCIMS